MKGRSQILTVSIITPVHHNQGVFEVCLQSLVKAASSRHEVIVVVDGAGDEFDNILEKYNVRVVKLDKSCGPAAARNAGARIARGDILFFIDSDVEVPVESVTFVANTFFKEPELDALFGSYDDQPQAQNFLSQYRNLLHHYTHQTSEENAVTFWGACGAIRRHVFLNAGGFDETYDLPSIEDIEFGYRLTDAGKNIRLCKSLQVKHLKKWNVRSMLVTDFFYRALPWTTLSVRQARLPKDLNLKISSRISIFLVFTLLLLASLAIFWPIMVPGMFVAAGLLLVINQDLYRFYWKRRGFIFVLGVIPWHWLYFLYSGIAFAMGIMTFGGWHIAGRFVYTYRELAKKDVQESLY